MGKYALAFGIIGTLISLIQVLTNLTDIGSAGPKIAVTFIATFYGVVVANLVFVPITVKLKRRIISNTLEMNLVLEGVLHIRKGVNSQYMKNMLENTVANI